MEREIKKFDKEIQSLRELGQKQSVELTDARAQNIKLKVLESVSGLPKAVPASQPGKWVVFYRSENFFRYTVSVLLGLSLLGGTAFASNGSKPGDLLFPVKLFTEKVQLGLAATDESKASLQAKFAEERLVELKEISALTPPNDIPQKSDAGGQNSNYIATSTNTSGSQTLSAVSASTSPAGEKDSQLKIQARQDAEAAVSQALKALEQVQSKLQDKGDSTSANSIGNDILNLRGQAKQQDIYPNDLNGDQNNSRFRQENQADGLINSGTAAATTSGQSYPLKSSWPDAQ